MHENLRLGNIVRNVTEIVPVFKKLPLAQRNWLTTLYTKNYVKGLRAIGKDVFSNPGYVTTQQLLERVKEYPEVSVHETDFMHRLAEGDIDALDAILEETKEKEDFVYSIYEENYVDWIPKSVRKILNIPKGLEKYDLDLLAQEAFSQGILHIIDKLARKAVVNYARKIVEEEEL